MKPPLRHTLCEHVVGNYRIACWPRLANELLTTAAQHELPELDGKVYFEDFAPATFVASHVGASIPWSPLMSHKPRTARTKRPPAVFEISDEAACRIQLIFEDFYLWFSSVYCKRLVKAS
jgi:hypothetical protein